MWLVRAGPEYAPLAQLGEGLGIERLLWTGFENSPGNTFAGIDCAVVPSVEPDSFPRAVIEAMSWSRAVIGSTSGGIAEAIVPGWTGIIVPAGDVEKLEREMEKLADDPAIVRAMGLAGRRVCEDKFAVANQMIRIEALYQEVLAEAR
jgi:glycosyltransferase involved in cell wall biosynthesis